MPCLDEFPAYRFWYVRYCGEVEQPTWWYRCRFWYAFILLCSFGPLQVLYLVRTPALDLMVTCEEIMLLQLLATVVLKFSLFVTRRDEIYDLVEAFKRIQKGLTADEFVRLVKCNVVHAKLARLYVIGTTIVLILYELNAIVTSVTVSLQQQHLHFETPFNFPFDFQHPALYALCFLHNLDAMLITVFISVTIDACYSEMASNLSIHFDIVKERFEKLNISAEQPMAERELHEVISYHSDVLTLAQRMTQLFQESVFYLLLLLSTILCLLGYEFVMINNIYKRAQVATLAGIMIGQAIIYTYHGSVIRDQSVNVSDAIYGTNWYEATTDTKKQIHFSLMRAQKPVIVKSGFIEASLPTLKKILSSSGSYITMLMSLEPDVSN
ncbi:odorant receptor 82a-like [Anopheles maculipalpis]|uniref:odorant receptor 82a-like n=1 Tax=Anopheles maculipalpis TaxID=1496333 RepID=UPI002158F5D2|nr:odorant receptor 82a-like [Anopheles maculipalpis]